MLNSLQAFKRIFGGFCLSLTFEIMAWSVLGAVEKPKRLSDWHGIWSSVCRKKELYSIVSCGGTVMTSLLDSHSQGVWDSRYATHDIAGRKIQALLADKDSARATWFGYVLLSSELVNGSVWRLDSVRIHLIHFPCRVHRNTPITE